MRCKSIKSGLIIFLTQIIPWLIIITIGVMKPLALEPLDIYINNVPAAFVISIMLGLIIGLVITIDFLMNRIILKKIDMSRIKTNLIVSGIHILIACISIIAVIGGEDL